MRATGRQRKEAKVSLGRRRRRHRDVQGWGNGHYRNDIRRQGSPTKGIGILHGFAHPAGKKGTMGQREKGQGKKEGNQPICSRENYPIRVLQSGSS